MDDVVRVVFVVREEAGDGVLREVRLASGKGRIDRWDGSAWVPVPGATCDMIDAGVTLTASELAARGIPA